MNDLTPSAAPTLGDVVQRAWSENRLFSVLAELTYRCNLDCFFCYNDLGLQGRALATEQWEAFFRDLAAMGVPYLVLSGGEPLAHPDFYRLGRTARDLGFVVRVKSNGHILGAAAARRIKEEIDPYLVEVSLHGARAETHDRQTRVPGSFARLTRHLPEMKKAGLRVKVNSTLTRWNEDEVEGMYALADSLDVQLQFDPEVTPRDNGDQEPLSIHPSRDGLRRLLSIDALRMESARARFGVGLGMVGDGPAADSASSSSVMRQTDDAPGMAPGSSRSGPAKHCGAGSSGIAVDPYGNVYPCVQWRRAAGNLHDAGIQEIWENSPALATVRRLTVEIKERLSEEFGADAPLLNFCPGNAESVGGDPFAVTGALRERLGEVRAARGTPEVATASGSVEAAPRPMLRVLR